MSVALLKGLLALVPAGLLLAGASISFVKAKTRWSFLQLLGAACLMLVVLTHICEAFDLRPWMHWGSAHSVGHYVDLGSAVFGLTLFPLGYFLQALVERHD